MTTTNAPLKLGIIGCGQYWSSRMHLPAIQRIIASQNVQYVATCDLNKAIAETYAHQIGAENVFADATTMFEQCQLDGVVIVVSVAVTPSIIQLAADHNVPFLVEKPPTSSVDIHKELIDHVSDMPHIVAYNRRHSPYITQAKDWLADQTIQSVTGHFTRYRRREPDFSGTAVHAIDTIRYLAGGDFATLRIDVVPVGKVFNYYLTGYTADNTRIDLIVTPDTGSAQEHYVIRSLDTNVTIVFPQPPMIDVPGYVEKHDRNRNIRRLGPTSFGLTPGDLPGLGGIVGEHTRFCQLLRGQTHAISTLTTSLQTQQIRQAIATLVQDEGGTTNIDFIK